MSSMIVGVSATATRRRRLMLGVLVAALLLTACSDGQVERTEAGGQSGYIEGDGAVSLIEPADRVPAPEFSAPYLDQDGQFQLADTAGEVVVLNVWGSWCPPCREEAPALQAVAEQVEQEDLDVQFVGVNTRDTETAALAYEEEFQITYPSVVDTNGEAMLAFRETLPPAAIPSTLVIDRQGRMAARVLGPITETSLRGLIDDVVNDASS